MEKQKAQMVAILCNCCGRKNMAVTDKDGFIRVKEHPLLFFSLTVPFLFFPIPSIGIMSFNSILVYFGMIALAIYTVRTLSAALRTRKASTME